MRSIIHNLALLATLVALGVGLWQDWGVWLAIKRMGLSYLVFYTAGSLLLFSVRMISAAGAGNAAPTPAKAQKRPRGS